MTDDTVLSIVIPHLNQPEHLSRCLAALRDQPAGRLTREIIVCDNGSSALPTGIVDSTPGARLIEEKTPGPGPARNAGILASRGAFLAFIDADCVADPGWVQAIERAFLDEGLEVFGGDVQVRYEVPERPTQIEAYERVYAYRNEAYVASGYSGTGNLAMRREVFDTVGEFAGIGVAEDQDWGLRAGSKGHATRFVSEMIVFHPARKSFAELAQKWDRHIAHDFGRRGSIAARAGFAVKALALLLSPLAEIRRLWRTPRLGSGHERLLAFTCLVRIRAYRAGRMAGMLLGFGRDRAASWNRTATDE